MADSDAKPIVRETPIGEEPPSRFDLGAMPSRLKLAGGGRAHVDRALPFLILHRIADPLSLAAQVAVTSPNYVLWPDVGDADALAAIDAIAQAATTGHRRVLLVSLYDLPRDHSLDPGEPKLEAFTARLSASDDPEAQAAAAKLTEALEAIEIDLRTCCVEPVADAWFEPGVEELVRSARRGCRTSRSACPKIIACPASDDVYPQLLHELSVSVFDALLQASHAFLAQISAEAPKSHRALGRQQLHRRGALGRPQAAARLGRVRFPAQRFADQFGAGLCPVQGGQVRRRARCSATAR